jgi:LPXTG-motif cell wall-anchored protein
VIVTLGAHSVSEALLAEALSLSAADDDGNGISAIRLSSLRECEPLIPVRVVQQNEPIAVTLSIAVSPTLVNRDAQRSISTSTINIGLTDPENTAALAGCLPDSAVVVPPAVVPTAVIPVSGPDVTVPDSVESARPTDESSAEQGSGLAATGFVRLQSTLIAAGTAVVAGGILLLVARRRRRDRA